MKKITSKHYYPVLSVLLVGAGLLSCLSSHQNSTLDGIESKLSASQVKSTYVEAYIEYTGPQKKWAGSPTFILHLQARENQGNAKVWVTPPLFYEEFKMRAPASTASEKAVQNNAQLSQALDEGTKVTVTQARARLAELANVIQTQSSSGQFKGCLYPVRAWVIKADGGIVEDRGCRGQGGWVKKASELVSDAVQASI